MSSWARRQQSVSYTHLDVYKRQNLDISYMNPDEIIKTTKSDKKMDKGVVKFILLDGLGNGIIVKDITDDEMLHGLSSIIK